MFALNLQILLKLEHQQAQAKRMELKKYNNRHYNWVIHLVKDFRKEIFGGGLVCVSLRLFS